MRLVKQSFLYFKEGNSDKVYEIDLCDVGNDKYVVNFRYGRRGSTLKEGSKTPVPVPLAEAEKIFLGVEEEKLLKGYTTSPDGVSSIPKSSHFTITATAEFSTIWMSMPNGRHKSILQRLHTAVQDTANTARSHWKLSRAIWKAGEYRIKEAAPYIIQLFNKGDAVHQYSCTWALARCANEGAAGTLQAIHKDHPSPAIAKMAGAGLLMVLNGPAKEAHLLHYLNALPEPFKATIEGNQEQEFSTLLQERISQQQPQFNWLEHLYLLSTDKKWIRPALKKILLQVPLKPGYFKHTRAVYKMAELLDDFEITGLLSCRLEREEAYFMHGVAMNDLQAEPFVQTLGEFVNPHKELQKKNSRLAYSQKTRWYLHRRTRRKLKMMGDTNNTDYVKLATALLISYNRKLDFKEPYSTFDYKWENRQYVKYEHRFPQNAKAVFMHQILSGNHPELKLVNGRIWALKSDRDQSSSSQQNTPAQKEKAGVFKKLLNLFGQKKAPEPAPQVHFEQPEVSPVNANGTPYLHLWNKLPQSFIQLLIEAQMEEIHEFALDALTTHPAWHEIKEKIDKPICKQLLLSPYTIPAEFGLTITLEKFGHQQPDADLVMAMLNSLNTQARDKGKVWTEQWQDAYFTQSEFIKDLLFAADAGVRQWARQLIQKNNPSAPVKNAVVGKCIAHVMHTSDFSEENGLIINSGADALLELFASELQEVSLGVIADLFQHPFAPVLLLGVRLLKSQKHRFKPEQINQSLLLGLLQHEYAPVREEGLSLAALLPDAQLLQYQDELLACCLSPFQNLRQGISPVIARMARADKAFGDKAAETLMPYLLRKETIEGLHADVSFLLCNELTDHLQNANKETALNLLYGNYAAAQNVGVVILEKYTDPSQLTIPQVIALGNHENLNVRNWCWKFYKEQTPRIQYEKETAIKLLESKWEDTRRFAMQYFREAFGENDWSPEALITLADSIKPDVEAFGRELITKFFNSDQGVTYLLKLSQHPSEKMQLFATNYLERFAADDVERIRSLEFYFRSVLTRVNKSRIAKNRIYQFLLTEGRKSEQAAKAVSSILSDVSATAAIGDKAKCIEILLQLKSLYEVSTPLQVKEIQTR